MAIPQISEQDIKDAISYIDEHGVPVSNKSVKYEFIDELPEDAIPIYDYNDHMIKNGCYFYSDSNDKFYFYNGERYRTLVPLHLPKCNALYVNMKDDANKQIPVYIDKLKQMMDEY